MVETTTGYFTQEILTGDQQAFDIKMRYKYIDNTQNFDVTVGAFTFNTTSVTLQFSGNIKYYAYGNHRTFTQPSMELLPASYDFEYFSTGQPMQTQSQTVSSCAIVKSLVIIKLEDSNGDGLEGGIAKYNHGGWQTAGTTDPNGYVLALIDGLQNTLDFRMYWEGTYIHKYQNIKTNSLVQFQTKEVSMSLLDSYGTTELIGTGKVNSGGWKIIGSTPSATKELLPRTYDFRIYYEDTYVHKYQDVGSNPKVQFQTELVTMSLTSSVGSTLVGEGKVNSGGWKSMGDTPGASMELLPRTYDFRIYYNGSYIHKYQNVGSNQNVTFQTVLVTTTLVDGSGSPISGGEGKVNSGGWKSLGFTPAATMELLPRTYDFRMYYSGSYTHKYQNVASNNIVEFTWDNGFKQSGFTPDYTTMLNKVYPNPFNYATTIEFSTEKEQNVIVAVYDTKGALVKTLINHELSAGDHDVTWNSQDVNGGDIKQGVYIVKLITAGTTDHKTIVKIR